MKILTIALISLTNLINLGSLESDKFEFAQTNMTLANEEQILVQETAKDPRCIGSPEDSYEHNDGKTHMSE